MSSPSTITFGGLLRQLRRRAQMTQGDLAAAVGYSVSLISSLEQNTRRPDVRSVLQHFVPALALQEEPHLATHLLELAAVAQGDLPPTGALTLTHPLRGQWGERGQWLSQLVPHRHALDIDLRLATLSAVYSTARSWEEFQPLARYTNEMMQLLEASSNKLLQATGWFWLAISIADSSADFPQAGVAWAQSIAFARAAWEEPPLSNEFCLMADRDFVLVSCIGDYATDLIERGEVARAVPFLAESLAILQRRGNHYEIADVLGTLGVLALVQGEIAQAHNHLHQAVTTGSASNHQSMVSNWPAVAWTCYALYWQFRRGESAVE